MEEKPEEIKTLSATESNTVDLLLSGLTPAQISEQRKIALNTVLSHLGSGIEVGKVSLNQVISLEQAIIDKISQAADKLNSVNENKLKPLYEALNEEVDYATLRCVLAHLKHQQSN
ncbi:hypothetical protein JCM19236_417 [Vibrio sp. JCM 19236]|nr:hypothetical protein JCM19236_417 [Vibrio sp. JCM 19236]